MSRKTLINSAVATTAFVSACFVLASDSYGRRLVFNRGKVFFSKSNSKAEATRLGECLVEIEFFDGAEKSVQLDKTAEKLIVRFCVQDDAAKDADILSAFRTIQSYMSTYVFEEEKVEVQLCNEYFKPLKILEPSLQPALGGE